MQAPLTQPACEPVRFHHSPDEETGANRIKWDDLDCIASMMRLAAAKPDGWTNDYTEKVSTA